MRWKTVLGGGLAIILTASAGCKQTCYLTECDVSRYMENSGIPARLECDPNAGVIPSAVAITTAPSTVDAPERPIRNMKLNEAITIALQQRLLERELQRRLIRRIDARRQIRELVRDGKRNSCDAAGGQRFDDARLERGGFRPDRIDRIPRLERVERRADWPIGRVPVHARRPDRIEPREGTVDFQTGDGRIQCKNADIVGDSSARGCGQQAVIAG